MDYKNISLEEFWNIVIRLNGDVKRCTTMLEETPDSDTENQYVWRRLYARAVFALIDSATYGMMFHAFFARNRPNVTFSMDELIRLEAAYDFDEDCEPVTTISKTRTLDDIRFAFNAFARVHYSDYILPIHDPGWALVKEIGLIRQTLQYPRGVQEVEVYDENISTLALGLQWFVERMLDVLKSCTESMAAYEPEQESDENEIVM